MRKQQREIQNNAINDVKQISLSHVIKRNILNIGILIDHIRKQKKGRIE